MRQALALFADSILIAGVVLVGLVAAVGPRPEPEPPTRNLWVMQDGEPGSSIGTPWVSVP